MKNSIVKFIERKEVLFGLICVFCISLGLALFVSFSNNTEEEKILIKSITPVYDEASTVVVNNNEVIFNDKNQEVKYNIVIENTQDYDVKISDINLSTPTEEFLEYEAEGINKDDVVKANATKELVVSFETIQTEGWGRNFSDELTASIIFAKVTKKEEPTPNPEPEVDKEEIKEEEKKDPVVEESSQKEEVEEEVIIPNDDLSNKVEDTKKDEEIKEETTEKEPVKEENETTKDDKESSKNSINIGKTVLVIGFSSIAGVSGILIIVILVKNKKAKSMILIFALISGISFVDANELIELPMTFNVSYESQNVVLNKADEKELFWEHRNRIGRIYIENEFSDVEDYSYKYDISESQNEKVLAYLVAREPTKRCFEISGMGMVSATCFDLILQSDGLMYFGSDASNFFGNMAQVIHFENLSGIDSSNVTDMSGMFESLASGSGAGAGADEFELDVSSLNTSKVTNMSGMFNGTGYLCGNFSLDVSNFDTSNVTDMSKMFFKTGYNSVNFTLDVSSFDTSKVTDMSEMFKITGNKSNLFNTSITIRNSDVISYVSMFDGVATNIGSQIVVNYTSDTSELVDKMIATKSTDSNVIKGKLIVDVDNLSVGDEIHISGEKFNVISQTDDTITMLAQYTLGSDYIQSTEENNFDFSDSDGWEYGDGFPKIDIQKFDGNAKLYVNNYVSFLRTVTGDEFLSGDLITVSELIELGVDESTYCDLEGPSWLSNGQLWYTSSSGPENSYEVWAVWDGCLGLDAYDGDSGIRPTITISKEILKNYLNS